MTRQGLTRARAWIRARAGAQALLLVLALGAPLRHATAEVIAAPGGSVTLGFDSGGTAGTCGDPTAAFARDELAACRLFFEPLYVAAADGTIAPRLAAGPIGWSPDRLVAVIPIHANIELHDGRELTAQDVAASLTRAQQAGRLVALRVDADLAKRAVVITLAAPRPDLAAELSAPWLAIAVRGVGTGPFARATAARGLAGAPVLITAARFAAYWRGPARLAQLSLAAPSSALFEARLFMRGGLWWSHAEVDVASGLVAPRTIRRVQPPVSSYVALVVRHRQLDLAAVAAAIDPVALGLALTQARTAVAAHLPSSAAAPPAMPRDVGTVPLYFDGANARQVELATKLAWQLRQRGLGVTLTPLAASAVVAQAAGAGEALVLVESLRCPACASAGASPAAGSALPLLWLGPRLMVRKALGGLTFDGWGLPVWEGLRLQPAAGGAS